MEWTSQARPNSLAMAAVRLPSSVGVRMLPGSLMRVRAKFWLSATMTPSWKAVWVSGVMGSGVRTVRDSMLRSLRSAR